MDKEDTVSEVWKGHDPLNNSQQEHSGVTQKDSIEKLIEKEKKVDRYIQNGRKDLAVILLYDLIISYAQVKNFSRAEDLREKLLQVDNMALSEIVNSAEIIEEEKSKLIDVRQLDLWKPLFHLLTTEESNAFYLAVKKIILGPGQTIIKQGKLNDKLFFIDKGILKLIFQQGEEEHYIRQINVGETVGRETFFPISVCTTSVITVNSVQLRYLDRSTLEELEEIFPGIQNKLQNFAFKSGERVEELLKRKEIERRRFERHRAIGTVDTQLIDKNITPIGRPLQGLLEDICEGGVSCFIKCPNKSSARLLLGRPVRIKMSFFKDGRHVEFKTNGLVVCAKFRFYDDYTIHIRFSRLIPKAQILEWIISI